MFHIVKEDDLREVYKWIKNGDHPEDHDQFASSEERIRVEGKVVRRYNHPKIDGDVDCSVCGQVMKKHGWIDQGSSGITVCPGSWIEKRDNKYYVLDLEFELTDYVFVQVQ